MASRELRHLFACISRRDWPGTLKAAGDIASSEESRGRHVSARALRDALRTNGQVATPVNSHAGVLLSSDPVDLDDVSLTKQARSQLLSVLEEHHNSSILIERGLRPRNKLLFIGSPGCGKTLTSKAIASALRVPHYTVRFDLLIGSLLGQTAMNIRRLFQIAEDSKCVMLFDELDAIGKVRGNFTEVGELDRIVIALMQELELSNPAGIIIAASNLPGALDKALLRRFDLQLSFPKPSQTQLLAFGKKLGDKYREILPPSILKQVQAQDSYDAAEQLAQNFIRAKILRGIR